MDNAENFFDTCGYKWDLTYQDFTKIIVEYYKNEKGLRVEPGGQIVLADSIKSKGEMGPFYITNSETGLVRFSIPKDELFKIFKAYYMNETRILTDPIQYFDDHITLRGKSNKNIPEDVKESIKKPLLNVKYKSYLGYDNLKDLIMEYYKKTVNEPLLFIDVKKVKEALRDNKDNGTICVSTVDNKDVSINREEIVKIIEHSLSMKNFKSSRIDFSEQVVIDYVEKESLAEDKKNEKPDVTIKKQEEKKEQPIDISNNINLAIRDTLNGILILEGVSHEYQVLQRDRLLYEAEKRKRRAAILAGIFTLSTMASIYLSKIDSEKVLKDEMNALTSWSAFVEYVEDLGPFTTLLGAGAVGSYIGFEKNRKLVKKYRAQSYDYMQAHDDITNVGEERD